MADHAAERCAIATDKRDIDRALAASIAGLLTINATGGEKPPAESTENPSEAEPVVAPGKILEKLLQVSLFKLLIGTLTTCNQLKSLRKNGSAHQKKWRPEEML